MRYLFLFDVDKKYFRKPPLKTFCYRHTKRGFHVRFFLEHSQIPKYLHLVLYWAVYNCDLLKFAHDLNRGWSALASEKWVAVNNKKTGQTEHIHQKVGRWKQATEARSLKKLHDEARI